MTRRVQKAGVADMAFFQKVQTDASEQYGNIEGGKGSYDTSGPYMTFPPSQIRARHLPRP